MSEKRLTQHLLLPELRFVKHHHRKRNQFIECIKVSKFEVCPNCATKSSKVYDHRFITPRDQPIRNGAVTLKIKKRRFICQNIECGKVFTEPVSGIRKGFRTTQRFRACLRDYATKYMNLKAVKKDLKVSSSTVYKAFYEQIELELRKSENEWPKTIGIDEHSFNRNVLGHSREFVTVFVDYSNKRMKEVILGKSINDLMNSRIIHIKGRENVKNVIVDLSPTFRSFAMDFFPNARLIADHFHVVKLMHPRLNELRKKVVEDNNFPRTRKNPINKLIYKSRRKLRYEKRRVIDHFLEFDQELKELYLFQQRLYRMYQVRGYKRAKKALFSLLDDMARSRFKKTRSYRQTLDLPPLTSPVVMS